MTESSSAPANDLDAGQPEIAHGQRVAAETDMIGDSDQVARVRFRQPIDHPLPVEEVTRSAAQGVEPGGAPIGDVGSLPDGPSVWEALPEEEASPIPEPRTTTLRDER